MVGRQVLALLIEVQILVPEQHYRLYKNGSIIKNNKDRLRPVFVAVWRSLICHKIIDRLKLLCFNLLLFQ